jgi:hypothetical protein
MLAMWGQEEQRNHRKELEASSREEETLRNDQRTSLHCKSDQERQAKDSTSEGDHSNTIDTIKRSTQKRADVVYSDANHLAPPRSKKPRMETTKGEEAGIRNLGGVEFFPKAYNDEDEDADQVNAADNIASMTMWSSTEGASDKHSLTGTDGDSLLRENLMVDSSSKSSTQTSSLHATLLRSSVENGEFQAANERLEQGFDRSLGQPCSKGDAAADARIQKLEQELHILEEELKNENQLLWEEDEKLYTDAVHNSTREATARSNGTYRARWTTMA